MSMSIQSRPDPAQISATSGDPEHTQMPASGRDAAASASRKVGARRSGMSIIPIGP